MKLCPFCKSEIDDDAKKCKNCGEWVDKDYKQREFGKTVAFAFFFGFLGVHRFYTGYKKIGTIQLILSITLLGLPVSMLWALVDIISICINKYKDAQNRELLHYNKTFGIIILVLALLATVINAHNAIEGWNLTNTESASNKETAAPVQKIKEEAKEDLEVLEDAPCKTELGSPAICGTVVNNTDKAYDYVQIEANFYDASGNIVDSSMDNINNLEPHGKWKFEIVPTSENFESYKIKGVSKW